MLHGAAAVSHLLHPSSIFEGLSRPVLSPTQHRLLCFCVFGVVGSGVPVDACLQSIPLDRTITMALNPGVAPDFLIFVRFAA